MIRAFIIAGAALLAASLLVPWAEGYGPGAPGRLFPVVRPAIPGLFDSLYLMLAAIAAGVVAAASVRFRAASLAAGILLAGLPWVWLGAYVIDPHAFGNQPLPDSGLIPDLGFWLVAAGLVAYVVPLMSTVAQRRGRLRPARGRLPNS